MVICPEASKAQNSIAAVSAEGSTVCVLMRRLNSSCSRSIAFVVRADFHWLEGSRVKVNSRSPASSKLSATAVDGRVEQRLALTFHAFRRPEFGPAPTARVGAVECGAGERTAIHHQVSR